MLELNIHFDQPDLPAEGEYRRHLLARVTPPQQEQNDDVAPLDLALVIDASGSIEQTSAALFNAVSTHPLLKALVVPMKASL